MFVCLFVWLVGWLFVCVVVVNVVVVFYKGELFVAVAVVVAVAVTVVVVIVVVVVVVVVVVAAAAVVVDVCCICFVRTLTKCARCAGVYETSFAVMPLFSQTAIAHNY